MNLLEIESSVFSRVKNKSVELQEQFSDLTFTTNNKVAQEPTFPNVYIHELSSIEQGETLDGSEMSAVMATIEVKVTDNESMENVTTVMNYVVKVMKSMRFSVVTMPEFRNSDVVFQKVARFRRIIADGDEL